MAQNSDLKMADKKMKVCGRIRVQGKIYHANKPAREIFMCTHPTMFAFPGRILIVGQPNAKCSVRVVQP